MITIPSKPYPDYADKMTVEDFEASIRSGLFVDDDGIGYYGSKTEMTDIIAIPSMIRRIGPYKGFTHVGWFNK